ncbi:MAG: hypothetical protein ACOX6H_04070 [Christensenellales bacterium]|jgi:hypothetical protein
MKFVFRGKAIKRFLPHLNKVVEFGNNTCGVETTETKLLIIGAGRKNVADRVRVTLNDFEVIKVYDPLNPNLQIDLKQLSACLRLVLAEIFGEEYKRACLNHFKQKTQPEKELNA